MANLQYAITGNSRLNFTDIDAEIYIVKARTCGRTVNSRLSAVLFVRVRTLAPRSLRARARTITCTKAARACALLHSHIQLRTSIYTVHV